MPSVNIIKNHPAVLRGMIAIERREYGETVGDVLQPDVEFVGYVVGCRNTNCSWQKGGKGLMAADRIGALMASMVRNRETFGEETELCGGTQPGEHGGEIQCPRTWTYSVRLEYR